MIKAMMRESERHFREQSKDAAAVANNGGMDALANMDNIVLDENGNTAGGKMATGATQQAAIQLSETFNKKKGDILPFLISEFEQWRDRLNERIAALEEQIKQMRERAEQAFEEALMADELREAIKDGISPKEQQAIVRLLGKDAEGKSIAELDLMLQAYEERRNSEGTHLSETADAASEQIAAIKSEMKGVVEGLPQNASEGAYRNAMANIQQIMVRADSITATLEATDQIAHEGVAGVDIVKDERLVEMDARLSDTEAGNAINRQSAFLASLP